MIDPHPKLIAALVVLSDDSAEALHACSRPWASVTFTGARHFIRLVLPSTAADRLAERLEAHEFAIPGHLVADIMVASRHDAGDLATLEIETLTIEDR